MASRTSNGTGGGNWNSTSTWSGGVIPDPAADTVTIAAADTVTITANLSQGGSPSTVSYDITVNGKLIVADGITFTVKTSLILGSTVGTLQIGQTNGGSSLVFDASSAGSAVNYRLNFSNANANIQSIATSGSHNTISSAGSGRNHWWYNGGGTNFGWGSLVWTDLTAVGDATNGLNWDQSTGSKTIKWQDCTMTSCGFPTMTIGASCNFTWQRVIHTTSANTLPVRITMTGTPSGTRLIDGNSFDKQVDFHSSTGGVIGATITNNFLYNVLNNANIANNWTAFSGNFIYFKSGSPTLNWCGDILNNFFYWDNTSQTDPNIVQTGSSNLAGTYTAQGNVLECNTGSQNGAWFYTQTNAAPSGAVILKILNNVVLPNDNVTGSSAAVYVHVSSSSNYAIQVDHNTGNIDAGTGGNAGIGLVCIDDSVTTSPPAGTFTSIRANIGWAPNTTIGTRNTIVLALVATTVNNDIVGPSVCGYNGTWNASTSSANAVSGSVNIPVPGYQSNVVPFFSTQISAATTDVANQNPQFVDSSRNLAKWYTDTSANGGQNHSTTGSASGDRAAAMALIQANPQLINSATNNLMAYLKGGVVPTNAAYNTTFGGDANAVTNLGAVPGSFGSLIPFLDQAAMCSFQSLGF